MRATVARNVLLPLSAPEPPRPPRRAEPCTEVLGKPTQPPTRKWWQHGCGAVAIGVVGLLVGVAAGIGASGSSSTKTVTAKGTTTTVQVALPPAHTVTRVVVHTHTVTQTLAAAPTKPSSGSNTETSSSGSAEGSYSGNGTKNLGTISVSQPSVLHWHATGGIFTITGLTSPAEHAIAVSSKASSGETVVEPGTYHEVSVIALGEWGVTITPQG